VAYVNLALPLGCLAVPLIGALLERSLTHGFILCNITALVYGIFTVVPIVQLQFITFVFFSVHRISLFSCMYSAVTELFGFKNFGRVLGLVLFVSAIVSLLQYPLALIVARLCNGSFLYVDLTVLVLIVLPLFPLCWTMKR
jgi:hypothetical protein